MFPRPQVQLAIGDSNHHLAAHDLAFVMRIDIVLARAIVVIPLGRQASWQHM